MWEKKNCFHLHLPVTIFPSFTWSQVTITLLLHSLSLICCLCWWEMLPGPGSACYWASMSWISWPLHTSLTQSDTSKTSSITYWYWYYALASRICLQSFYRVYFCFPITMILRFRRQSSKIPSINVACLCFVQFCFILLIPNVLNSPPY